MTSFFLKLCGLLAIGAFGFWWIGRGVWRTRRAAREVATAGQAFSVDRHALESRLFDAASQTGKPPGLTWKQCVLLPGEPLMARDVTTGELYALASAKVSFATDSMDRQATTVFIWRGGQWVSEGRVMFDLEPKEMLKRYSGSLISV